MAKFPKLQLTKQAIKALQTSLDNQDDELSIRITHVGLGDGQLSNNTDTGNMTSLISEKQICEITSEKVDSLENTIKITAINNNKNLDTGYYLREIGVFGFDVNGERILIAYANAGDECDYIPDKSNPIDAQIFKIKFAIGNTDKLKVTIKDDTVVTIKQFKDHIKDPNAHASIFSKLKEWIKEIFATKAALKNHENYAENTYLKTKDLPKIDFSPYLKKRDAEYDYLKKTDASNTYLTKYNASEKYQPKGDYLTESKANSRFLWEYNFKDKLLEVLGVRYSIEENGYICFGPLFGGLIIQWGRTQNLTDNSTFEDKPIQTFPITFAVKCLSLVASVESKSSMAGAPSVHTYKLNKAQFVIAMDADEQTPSKPALWMAIGR